jgi:hypothetical protein
MHLVGYTIEIYHNARPYERQIMNQVIGFAFGYTFPVIIS